jgi:hypothetical protein
MIQGFTIKKLDLLGGDEYFKQDHLLQQEKQPVGGSRLVMGMVETYRHSASGWIGTIREGGPGSTLK